MSELAIQHDAKRSAVRAIKALAELIDGIDAGSWLTILCDDLPHIEANIAHVRALAEQARRG